MGAFDKFKNADVMGVRSYIEAGKSRLYIKSVMQGDSKHPKRPNIEKTVAEFKIMETDAEKMKVGNTCSLVEMSSSQGYYGNVLAFVAGVLGVTIDEMKSDPDFDSTFGAVFGVDQIFNGMLVDVVAQQVATTATDAKSDVYTAKSWEPVPGTEYEKYGLVAPAGAYVPG